MTVRPISRPPAPFTAPTIGDLDVRLAVIAAEINKKANAGGAGPAYAFIGLVSPNGTTWRLTVDNTGALHTEAAPRS